MPYGLTTLIGDMFANCGVPIHYSEVDNDDTIAAYAQKDNACILSGDRDFNRYIGSTFTVYREFEINKGILNLILSKPH